MAQVVQVKVLVIKVNLNWTFDKKNKMENSVTGNSVIFRHKDKDMGYMMK